MKKGLKKLLLTFIVFLFPIIVWASPNVTTEITGSSNGKPGDTIAYDIKIVVPSELKASNYTANIEYNKDILELKAVTAKDWTGSSNSDKLVFEYEEGITGTSTIATVTFKIKDNVPKQTTIISLKDISITVIDEDESSSIVSGFDETSPSLRASLTIKSTDNTLKSIAIDGENIKDFKSDVTDYKLTVTADKSEVELKATPNNANATFQDGFGNRKISLDYGENEVLIKVQSEIGEVKTYKLIITREDDRNTNNNLKEVIINSGKIKINLSNNRVDYVIQTYKLKSLEIDAVAIDPNAKVTVQLPKEIIIGDNVAIITVTSESGEDKVYTITFQNSDEAIDTKIKTLYISGYKIDFDKNTMVYEVAYNKKYKKGLDIKVVTVASNDLVEHKIYYNGQLITDDINIDLKVGDTYEIVVTPLGMEEGDESEATVYTIEIVKDKRISFYFLLELLILVILVILIIIQVVRRNKNKKEDKKIVTKEKSNPSLNKEKDKPLKEETEKTMIVDTQELIKMEQENKK